MPNTTPVNAAVNVIRRIVADHPDSGGLHKRARIQIGVMIAIAGSEFDASRIPAAGLPNADYQRMQAAAYSKRGCPPLFLPE